MEIAMDIIQLLRAYQGLERRERPEVRWLKQKYAEFIRREGLPGRAAADERLFERMYGRPPSRSHDTLKIRYWRTGHHLPATHAQCRAFGAALGLDPAALRFLLQGYYDGCDEVHENEPSDRQCTYWQRRAAMQQLVESYLRQVPDSRLKELRITSGALQQNIRHLYYTDALHYVSEDHAVAKIDLNRHISSITYDSELGRNLKLLGVIPRKTMIRHLIILGAPQITLPWLNAKLEQFGYLPLQEWHTTRHGERPDWLLIRFLQAYEVSCRDMGPEERRLWLRQSCGLLDRHLAEQGKNNLRFMFFRALGG